MKKLKKWKRFIALLVVLALVIQCNFNAIALDSNEDNQQQAGAVVEEMMDGKTATEEENEEPKQKSVEEQKEETQEKQETVEKTEEPKEESKQEAAEEKSEEPKQETAEEKSEEPKQEAAEEKSEEPKQETAEEKSEESKQETAEEKSEESKQETSEEKQEAVKEEEQKEVAEEKTQEETEEKEEAKTSFSYSDNRVSIQATADKKANFPQNTVLKADYLKPGSEEYKQAAALAESKYGGDGKELEFVFYDIYFESDGKRIEPEAGNVTVTVDFKKAVLPDSEETESSTHEVIHISGSKVEKVTDQVTTNDQGAATSMKFTSDSFSVYGDMKVSTLEEAGEGKTYSMDPMITSVTMKVEIDGTEYDLTDIPEGKTVPREAPVDVKITYNPQKLEGVSFQKGDSITYQLPNGITIMEEQKGNVTDTPFIVGNYVIQTDGKIIITLTNKDYLEWSDGKLKNGTISFSGKLNSDALKEDDGNTIKFNNDVSVTIPFTPKQKEEKGDIEIEKTASEIQTGNENGTNYKYIEYTITVSTPAENTMTMNDVEVTDTFTDGSKWIDSIFGVSYPNGTTFDQDKMTWYIGSMGNGQQKVLTYKAKVKDAFLADGTDTSRTITNIAKVSSGEKTASATVTKTANAGISIEKEAEGYNEKDNTVNYTVKVKTGANNSWTLKDVKVHDVFGNYKDYVTEYMEVNPEDDVTIDFDDKELIWNIGDMGSNQTATLTYKVKIDDKIFLNAPTDKEEFTGTVNRTLNNTATIWFGDTATTIDSDANVTFKKEWIKKSGSPQNDGRVEFDIYVNAPGSGPSLEGGTLTVSDELKSNDWKYDGTLAVYRYSETSKEFVQINDSISNMLTNIEGKTSWEISGLDAQYYYRFVYYAKYTGPEIGAPSVTNSAKVGIGIGGSTYDHETGWSGARTDFQSLTKTFDGIETVGDTKVAHWTSKITNSIPAGTVYTDYRTDGYEWEMTNDQFTNIKVTGATSKGNCNITRNEDGKGFRIVFIEAVSVTEENPIVISYSTTLKTDDVAEGDTVTYINRAKLFCDGHENEVASTCNFTQEQRIKKEAGEYKDGLVTWNIKVNVTGSLSGDAVITDTLPDGLEYVKAEITDRGSKAVEAGTTMDKVSVDGQEVTLHLSNLKASDDDDMASYYITITLTTKVVDEEFLVSNVSGKKFKNKAILNDGGKFNESEAEITISNEALTKKGIYDSGTAPDIVYTIEVNKNGLDMLQDEKKIRVTDTMSDGLMLKTDTLIVTNMKTGATISLADLNLEIDGNTFSFDIPDDVHIKITYSCYVEGEVNENVDVTNTASFSGNGSTKTEINEKNSIAISESRATIEGFVGFFINKKDGVTYDALEGAEYKLCELNADGSIPDETEVEKWQVQTSNSYGLVTFNGLDTDAVYAFKESKAPDGYYVDSLNSGWSYVAFKKSSITKDMEAKGLDIRVIQKGVAFDRYNYKGEITVTKSFNGDVMTDGSYYFGLFNTDGKLVQLNGKNTIGEIKVQNGAIVKAANSVVFKGVPFGTYSVYETDSEGNILGENGNAIIVNDTKYTVSEQGTVMVSKEKPKTAINVKNTFLGNVELTKIDGEDISNDGNPKPLAGAEFELYQVTEEGDIKIGETLTTDADGKIKVADLSEGTYYFIETKAPEGYIITKDENEEPWHYSFFIGLNEQKSEIVTNATVTAGNTQTKVYIRKVDTDGKLLSGAKMAVIDPDTKQIVEQWTTDGTVKEITGKLIAGKTYYLSELEAPEGYLIGAGVEFTVATDVDTTEVEMTDPKDEGKEKLGSISVTKKIVSREIAGDYELYANDATYYVGLFTDPDGNHPYGQNAIREAHIVNGSTSEPVVYENLPTGTYYVLETTKDGTPIPMNSEATDGKNSFVCEVTGGGTNAVEIDTKAAELEGKVNLTNAYLELPDGFAYRAFIDITKKVLENGTEQSTNETFYAGIFTSETEAAPMTVVELKNNGTVTVEVPLGGPEGNQPITYYVYETDAQGNKIDKDAFVYLVSGEGEVSVAKEKLQSDITITNNQISEVSLEILKVDEDGYGLEGAKFQITSADGKTVLKKWKSDEESQEIILAPGTYNLTETAAPEGYIKGSDVTITISKDGTISVEGEDATLTDSVIEYVNQKDDSTSTSDDSTSKPKDKKGGTSRTGDPTHIMFYAVLLAAALFGCMAVFQRRKGRHNR